MLEQIVLAEADREGPKGRRKQITIRVLGEENKWTKGKTIRSTIISILIVKEVQCMFYVRNKKEMTSGQSSTPFKLY